MEERQLVSVIIPLYNKVQAIRNTLQSVLNQTYKDIEVVVVDDGSIDGSAAIVREMALSDSRLKYFFKNNGGVSSARNYGLNKATGEWIVFLDADDEMLPHNIGHLVELAKKYQVDIAAGNIVISTEDGSQRSRKIRTFTDSYYKNCFKAIIRKQAFISNGATLFNRLILRKNPYDEKLSRYEDAEFEIMLLNRRAMAFSPKVITIIHEEFAELSLVKPEREKKDFIFNMVFTGKTFWQKVYMGRFIKEGCYTYSMGKSLLKKKYGLQYYWRYVYIIISKYYGGIFKLETILGICSF